ncbi:MAG: PaaI family thioesterase [Candidatus Omnitrophica bacterium]|nr:PaaI family thioesterase [Candidatus Omnitrophota bacterium]
MTLRLEDDKMCYVCGSKNEKGLRLSFEHSKEGHLRTTVVFDKSHQGFKDMVHGGVVAMVLDEMMVNLAWKEGMPAVTAELKVRLKKPIRVGEKVCFEGTIEKRLRKIVYASSTAKNLDGEILASAWAACLCVDK